MLIGRVHPQGPSGIRQKPVVNRLPSASTPKVTSTSLSQSSRRSNPAHPEYGAISLKTAVTLLVSSSAGISVGGYFALNAWNTIGNMTATAGAFILPFLAIATLSFLAIHYGIKLAKAILPKPADPALNNIDHRFRHLTLPVNGVTWNAAQILSAWQTSLDSRVSIVSAASNLIISDPRGAEKRITQLKGLLTFYDTTNTAIYTTIETVLSQEVTGKNTSTLIQDIAQLDRAGLTGTLLRQSHFQALDAKAQAMNTASQQACEVFTSANPGNLQGNLTTLQTALAEHAQFQAPVVNYGISIPDYASVHRFCAYLLSGKHQIPVTATTAGEQTAFYNAVIDAVLTARAIPLSCTDPLEQLATAINERQVLLKDMLYFFLAIGSNLSKTHTDRLENLQTTLQAQLKTVTPISFEDSDSRTWQTVIELEEKNGLLTALPPQEGGMGRVYKVRQINQGLPSQEIYALKVLLPNLVGDASLMARFEQEINLMREVSGQHPCAVTILGCGTVPTQSGKQDPFYVMPWEPISLSRYLATSQPTADERVKIIRYLVDYLQFLWTHRIIHRDVKPNNLMRGNSPEDLDSHPFRLGDLGVGKTYNGTGNPAQTQIATFVGTLEWTDDLLIKRSAAEAPIFDWVSFPGEYAFLPDIFSAGLIMALCLLNTPGVTGRLHTLDPALRQDLLLHIREIVKAPATEDPEILAICKIIHRMTAPVTVSSAYDESGRLSYTLAGQRYPDHATLLSDLEQLEQTLTGVEVLTIPDRFREAYLSTQLIDAYIPEFMDKPVTELNTQELEGCLPELEQGSAELVMMGDTEKETLISLLKALPSYNQNDPNNLARKIVDLLT